jgi:hypothetical protein
MPLLDVQLVDPVLGINDLYPGAMLNPGAAWYRSRAYTVSGPVTNVATAIGDVLTSGMTSNSSHAVIGTYAPSMNLTKSLFAGHGPGSGCLSATNVVSVPLNQPVTHCYLVENTGDTWLTVLSVEDPSLGIDLSALEFVSGEFPLPPGGRLLYAFPALSQGDLFSLATAGARREARPWLPRFPHPDPGGLPRGWPLPADRRPTALCPFNGQASPRGLPFMVAASLAR